MISIKQRHLKTFVVILLCVCTISFFNGYPRYQVTGAEILKNAKFHEGLAHWNASQTGVEKKPEPNAAVKLSITDPGRPAWISQIVDLPYPGMLLLFSCDIKTKDIVDGDHAWETGRVVLLSLNGAGKPMYSRPHLLFRQNGSHDWTHVEKTFEIGPDVSRIEVATQLYGDAGELWIKSFNLRPVMLKSTFMQYRLMLLIVWLFVAVWIGRYFVRSGFKSLANGAVLLLSAGITLGVLMPEGLKESVEVMIWPSAVADKASMLSTQINDTQHFRLSPKLPNPDIFKVGHFMMFALLTFTLAVGKPYKLTIAKLTFYLCLMAVVSEVLQLFMAKRSSQMGDIFIDSGGIAMGLALSSVWRFINMTKVRA